MQKKTRVLFIVAGLLLCSCLYVDSCTNFSYKNLIPQRPVPREYQSYQTLDNYKNNNIFSISRFLYRPHYYDSVNNNIICVAYPENPKRMCFHKLNANGRFTDSLITDYELEYESGYILNPYYYYDWVLTGDSSKHFYTDMDAGFIKDDKALDSVIDRYTAESKATYTFAGQNLKMEDRRYNKYMFLIGKEWCAFKVSSEIHIPYDKQETKYTGIALKYLAPLDDQRTLFTGKEVMRDSRYQALPKMVHYTAYFDKQEYHPEHISGRFMSPTGGRYYGAFWEGETYNHLVFGTDTLKYKTEDVEMMDKIDWHNLPAGRIASLVYTNSRLNFIILDNFMVRIRK